MKLHAQFEDRIHRETWAKGHYCVRIPTGARVVGGGRMLSVKTPFDFAAGIHGRAVFFDAKSTKERTFNVGSYVMATQKVHQYRQLMEAHRAGSTAGYLIWFYTERLITWAPITVIGQPGRTSINPTTEGCRTMPDNRVIDLCELLGLGPPPILGVRPRSQFKL